MTMASRGSKMATGNTMTRRKPEDAKKSSGSYAGKSSALRRTRNSLASEKTFLQGLSPSERAQILQYYTRDSDGDFDSDREVSVETRKEDSYAVPKGKSFQEVVDRHFPSTPSPGQHQGDRLNATNILAGLEDTALQGANIDSSQQLPSGVPPHSESFDERANEVEKAYVYLAKLRAQCLQLGNENTALREHARVLAQQLVEAESSSRLMNSSAAGALVPGLNGTINEGSLLLRAAELETTCQRQQRAMVELAVAADHMAKDNALLSQELVLAQQRHAAAATAASALEERVTTLKQLAVRGFEGAVLAERQPAARRVRQQDKFWDELASSSQQLLALSQPPAEFELQAQWPLARVGNMRDELFASRRECEALKKEVKRMTEVTLRLTKENDKLKLAAVAAGKAAAAKEARTQSQLIGAVRRIQWLLAKQKEAEAALKGKEEYALSMESLLLQHTQTIQALQAQLRDAHASTRASRDASATSLRTSMDTSMAGGPGAGGRANLSQSMGRQAKAARSSQQRVGLSMSTKEALFRGGSGAGAGAPGGDYTDHYGSDYGSRLGRSLSDAAARADAGISDLRIFAAAAVDASTCAAENARGGGNGAAEASLRGMTAAMMAGGFQPRGAAPPAVPPVSLWDRSHVAAGGGGAGGGTGAGGGGDDGRGPPGARDASAAVPAKNSQAPRSVPPPAASGSGGMHDWDGRPGAGAGAGAVRGTVGPAPGSYLPHRWAGDADQSSLLALREAILQGEREREAARGGGRASRVGSDVENGAGTDGTAFTPLSTQQAQGQWQLQSQQKQQQREQQPGVGRLGKGEDDKRQQPHADQEEVDDDDASTSAYSLEEDEALRGGFGDYGGHREQDTPPSPEGVPHEGEEDCAHPRRGVQAHGASRERSDTAPSGTTGGQGRGGGIRGDRGATLGTVELAHPSFPQEAAVPGRPAVGNVAEGTAGGPSAADGDAADGNPVEGDAEGVGAEAGDALGWGGGVLAAALPSLSLDLVDGSAFSLDEIEAFTRQLQAMSALMPALVAGQGIAGGAPPGSMASATAPERGPKGV
eukprot:jgi/Mesvir1/2072/Mv02325-RA.1